MLDKAREYIYDIKYYSFKKLWCPFFRRENSLEFQGNPINPWNNNKGNTFGKILLLVVK